MSAKLESLRDLANESNELLKWFERRDSLKDETLSEDKRPGEGTMIPDSESVCQTSEAAVRSTDVYRKIKNIPEGEAASVTAWKRYQQLVAIVESRGGKFNRKSMIEAIFRGNDLVYASH
ncbi:hypothetical protein WN48_04839 [Eufriesea mexicana]|uniref:Uncharacterized protein n=1 Tax=Eufriesea mexicana TaxID=516756 RepID=A0A310SLL0_9HYME|nr:hypothetical protein WN48_04839 [Eufriesea mexicana]